MDPRILSATQAPPATPLSEAGVDQYVADFVLPEDVVGAVREILVAGATITRTEEARSVDDLLEHWRQLNARWVLEPTGVVCRSRAELAAYRLLSQKRTGLARRRGKYYVPLAPTERQLFIAQQHPATRRSYKEVLAGLRSRSVRV